MEWSQIHTEEGRRAPEEHHEQDEMEQAAIRSVKISTRRPVSGLPEIRRKSQGVVDSRRRCSAPERSLPKDKSSFERQLSFKNLGKWPAELHRRRQETNVVLRKAKQDNKIQKRRNVSLTEDAATNPKQKHSNQPSASVSPSLSIEDIVAGIHGSDKTERLKAVKAAGEFLRCESNPPTDLMIQVPHFVRFLTQADEPQLQFEAAWVLTGITSGTSEQTKLVVSAGAVPALITLLSSRQQCVAEPAAAVVAAAAAAAAVVAAVAEPAVLALANIAVDGPELRDYTISCGIVAPLLELVWPDTSVDLLLNITWIIGVLCASMIPPPPPFDVVGQCLAVLIRLVHHEDTEVTTNACWALTFLTHDYNDEMIGVFIQFGIVPRLVELLKSKEASAILPALRTLGNIVTCSDAQRDTVVKAGALVNVPLLLKHSKADVVEEAARTISNVTAGNQQQIQAVIDAGLLGPVLEVLQKGSRASQCGAVWVIRNLTSGGSQDQVAELCRLEVIKPLCDLLADKDPELITIILEALSNILRYDMQMGKVGGLALQVEDCGGLDHIEDLKTQKKQPFYNQAVSTYNEFFENKNDENVQLVPPAVDGVEFQLSVDTDTAAAGGFQF